MSDDIYHSPWEAYPFLSEPAQDLRCDFELLTDELASLTGLLRSLIPDKTGTLREDLLWVCEILYHLNPALRAGFRLTADETEKLRRMTGKLETKTSVSGFVLPVGTPAACTAHLLRVRAKSLVRLLYAYCEQGHRADSRLIDTANLLSGYFFLLALRLNALAAVSEIPFGSRAY